MSAKTERLHARSSQRFSGPVSSRELSLRTHPLIFGVVLFLAQDLMLFGGLIAAYFNFRAIDTVWPPAGVRLDEHGGAVSTGLLALSSLTMLFVTHEIAKQAFLAARMWLGTTIVLGTAFLFLSIHGWSKNTFRVDSHAYGSIYYVMTGFHMLHVAIGIVLMLVLFLAMRTTAFERDRRAGVEAIGYYWHFVFLVWLLIWGSIYVVR